MDLIWGKVGCIVYHPKDNLGQKIKAVWGWRHGICNDYTWT